MLCIRQCFVLHLARVRGGLTHSNKSLWLWAHRVHLGTAQSWSSITIRPQARLPICRYLSTIPEGSLVSIQLVLGSTEFRFLSPVALKVFTLNQYYHRPTVQIFFFHVFRLVFRREWLMSQLTFAKKIESKIETLSVWLILSSFFLPASYFTVCSP